MSETPSKILEILKLSTAFLQKNLMPSPRLEAELIISHVLNCKRLDLYLRFDQPLKSNELDAIRVLLKRRQNHEPIQHILGKTDFYNCTLKVDNRALIPRSDTETLVEEVINLGKNIQDLQVLDIGTGSGCIAVTLAKNLQSKKIAALDISQNAIDLAQENAELNQVKEKIIFAVCDIMKPFKVKEKFDIIVSNPPYIAETEMPGLDKEVKDFEPQNALTDGADGLSFYRRLVEILPASLKNEGWLIVEIGYQQAVAVQEIFSNSGLQEITVIKDLSGNHRVVRAKFVESSYKIIKKKENS